MILLLRCWLSEKAEVMPQNHGSIRTIRRFMPKVSTLRQAEARAVPWAGIIDISVNYGELRIYQ
jgi:hypothetical protein